MRHQLTVETNNKATLLPMTMRSLVLRVVAAALAGMALAIVLAQFPATHVVDIGGLDAAYTRGFHDPDRASATHQPAYLEGSSGMARWSRAESYLLFPQSAFPGEVMLRLRGWRAEGVPPEVTVAVDGGASMTVATTGEWQDVRLAVDGGLRKPEDVLVIIRAPVAVIGPEDSRRAGVLLDTAVYRTGGPPVWPYPAQVIWFGMAGALLYLALVGQPGAQQAASLQASLRRWVMAIAALALAYLFLYRLQMPYPYPLRGMLPTVCAALAAVVAIRHGPALAARWPALPDALALAGLILWTGVTFVAAQDHVTLSVPGVEKDFRVFATRAVDLELVLRADGFYNLGYPLLLWAVTPLTSGNVFLAARLIAVISGMIMLGAGWWLTRRLLGREAALLALLALALNPFVAQYTLYIGSDMPFAAFCMLALTLLLGAPSPWRYALAGVGAGIAFLTRHPGLLLLFFGILAILVEGFRVQGFRVQGFRVQGSGGEIKNSAVPQRSITFNLQPFTFHVLLFAALFLITISPQLYVNFRDTGNLLYNQQAKNVWLAVYGDSNWGRWNEVSNDVTLTQVIADDPARFAAAWWANLRAFLGTGAEDTSEFGRAMQLRMLAFPANWLALAGLTGWLLLLLGRRFAPASAPPFSSALLLLWIALYVVTLSVGLPLQRFFLPLAPLYALAMAWALVQARRFLAERYSITTPRLWIATGLVLLLLLRDGFTTGARYVLDQQPGEQVAIIRLVEEQLPPDATFAAALEPGDAVGKYSAIAHRVAPDSARSPYLLYHTASGPLPEGVILAQAGAYLLFQVE